MYWYLIIILLICILGMQINEQFQKIYSEVRYIRQLFTAPGAKLKFSKDGKSCTLTITPFDEEE